MGDTALRTDGNEQTETMSVLCIDDRPFQEELATALEGESPKLDVVTVDSPQAGLDSLDGGTFDCVISRYRLSGMDGLELFEAVRERGRTIPVILYTADGVDSIAEEALAAGVSGYVRGDQQAVLANRIETEVQRHRSQKTARKTQNALEATRDGIAIFDDDGTFQYVNEAYASFYGYRPDELVGGGWEQLYPETERERYQNTIVPILRSEGGWIGECECLHRDGFQFRSTHSISQLEDGGHVCIIHSGSVAASDVETV